MRSAISALVVLCTLAACGGGGNTVVPPPPASPVVTPMSSIQGSGGVSPLEGQTVTVRGIVTGDFQDGDADAQNELGGFYLQEETPDADPATSDAVFVFDGATPSVDVNSGDLVTVDGTVVEFFGETQITATNVEIAAAGIGAIEPTDLVLPTAATTLNSDGEPIADLERFEGMLVRLPQPLTVTGLSNLERFGEILMSQGGRLIRFTNEHEPDVSGFAAHRDLVAARSIILDDGLSIENANPVRYLEPSFLAPTPYEAVRIGDTITFLTGNIRFARGSGNRGSETYRLMPTLDPSFTPVNARPAAAPDVGGSLTVASFNVLNFFTTIDSGQNICGPSGNGGCRGADSQEEFDRQRSKIVNAVLTLDADIVGLMEVENNMSAALQSLVDGLNSVAGAGTYAFVDSGTIGFDAIKQAFLYKPASVSTTGAFSILDANVDPRFDDRLNRPSLAQSFVQNSNGAVITIAVNHLKSKGSPCNGDPDLNDGQGNCNITRSNAAAALADWMRTDPTASGDPDALIIGDMNAYLQEDPITILESSGYQNLLEAIVGADSYTLVFRGLAGTLDYAFASTTLATQVTGAAVWHINADESPVHDYNLEFGRDPGIFDGTNPYRASDHDVVLVGLDLSP